MTIKNIFLFCFALILFTGSQTVAADLVLADRDKSDYQIIVPDALPTASLEDCLRQTARLLQTAFHSNGFKLDVLTEAKRDTSRPGIYLGNTAFARANGFELEKLKGWGYIHKVVGRDVIIAGRDIPSPDQEAAKASRRTVWDRVGTAKGVADFLRQYVGTRFLYPELPMRQSIVGNAKIDLLNSPGIEFLKSPVIKIPAGLDVQKTPPLEFNSAYPESGSFYDLANNRFPPVSDIFGGHTYERAIPVETYAKTHPEYFALIGGKRSAGTPGNAQYCISNPDVQELMYQDLQGWADRGYDVVDLGQPDGFRPCQCEQCLKLYDTGADWNEKLWIFHRKLAERFLEARPGKQVVMMSYIQTELPPKTFKKLPANTIVLLSGTNEEDIAKWRSCEVPGGFSSYIYNSTPNLGTRYTPMRTPRYVAEQAKRLVANHIRSIYRDGNGMLFGLEGPVYYTMGRMFDDPENNQPKLLVHEFCEGAFGKSAPSMVGFYDQLYHGIELYSEFLGTRSPAWAYTNIYGQRRKYLTDPFQLIGFLYTPNLLAALETQLAQAEKLADTDKAKLRLALVRREFDYLKGFAKVVHLHNAYQIQPDLASPDRLLDAIDARTAEIATYFDQRGGAKPMAGWAYVPFPLLGHDAKHLQLSHNGYQEPYANTAFNWDTKAMRVAPLSGAKRMIAARALQSPVKLDSPQWNEIAASQIVGYPLNASVSQDSRVRVMFDATNVYVHVESGVPAQSEKPSAGEDWAKQESVSIYLAPTTNREIAYRFTVGIQADSKKGAAMGFISDLLDPRHGKFDPDWKGEWSMQSRVETAKNLWSALVTIPYKTLGVEPPQPGAFWRGNIGRTHLTATGAERSMWSVAAGSKSVEDLNDFGEIVFEDSKVNKKEVPMQSSLQKTREDLYRTSFEVPSEWMKLQNPLPKPLGPWSFRKDPIEQGVKQAWFAIDVPMTDWTSIRVPAFWAETESVGKFEGYGWYRTTFEVPATWQGRALRLHFGAVDEQAWIYVNGKLIREHTETSERKSLNELWEEPFIAEVPATQVNYGKPNVLAVRVLNSIANGGIWRPVLVNAVESK